MHMYEGQRQKEKKKLAFTYHIRHHHISLSKLYLRSSLPWLPGVDGNHMRSCLVSAEDNLFRSWFLFRQGRRITAPLALKDEGYPSSVVLAPVVGVVRDLRRRVGWTMSRDQGGLLLLQWLGIRKCNGCDDVGILF